MYKSVYCTNLGSLSDVSIMGITYLYLFLIKTYLMMTEEH
jgi:hypothetical protein